LYGGENSRITNGVATTKERRRKKERMKKEKR
jgi:hypothetical protein